MYKEFLTSKWFFAGIGFVIVFGLGCYLWFQSDLTNFRQQHPPLDEETTQLVKSEETEHSGNLQAELTDDQPDVQSVKSSSNSIQIADASHIVSSSEEDNSENSTDAALEGTSEETTVTEKTTEENLSPEELRKRELGKRLKEIFAQMKTLSMQEGGRVDASSSPEARREMQQLTTEMFQIMQEGAKEEDRPVLNFFTNLMAMGNNLVNSKGEMVLSEHIKMADQMEAAGMGEIAKGIRAFAQRAIDNGYEVIKPEEIQSLMEQTNTVSN